MSAKSDFYWASIKRGFEGSIDVANSWSQILGAAIVFGLLTLAGKPSTMPETIPSGIAFGLICIGAAWVVVFAYRVIRAAGELFTAQHTQLQDYQERLTPRLKCSFDKSHGCQHRTKLKSAGLEIRNGVVNPAPVFKVNNVRYFRIRVESNGFVPNCSAHLISLKRDGITLFDKENLALVIAAAGQEPIVKDVRDGVPVYVDLFVTTDENRVLICTPNFEYPISIWHETLFSGPGEYRFQAVVSAPSTVSDAIDVILKWNGDWDTAEAYAA